MNGTDVALVAGGFGLLNIVTTFALRWIESRSTHAEDERVARIAKLEAQVEQLQAQLTDLRDQNIRLTVELAFKAERVRQLEEELKEARRVRLITAAEGD